MDSKQLRTANLAYLMPFYVRSAPIQTWKLNELERAYLAKIKEHACFAISIPCNSENAAWLLMNAYTTKLDCLRGIERVTYPTIVPVDLVHFKIEGVCKIGVVREFVCSNKPETKTLQIGRYFFVIDLVTTDLGDMLDKLTRRQNK